MDVKKVNKNGIIMQYPNKIPKKKNKEEKITNRDKPLNLILKAGIKNLIKL